MAIDIPPPAPSLRRSAKGEPPASVASRNNLAKPEPNATVPLNFKVPASFRRDFKHMAADYGVTQSELLQRLFAAFRAKGG